MFARKVRYAAHDGDGGASRYIALIELVKRKGGRPIEFVLYRRILNYYSQPVDLAEMICRLSASTAEEAIRCFWLPDKGTGKEFPGHRSDRWKKTTSWLDLVAAGGWYERFGYTNDHKGIRLGNWVKVGNRPVPWAKRRKGRKKKPLEVGNLAHLLLKHQARLHILYEERSVLNHKVSALMTSWKSSSFECDGDSDENYVPEYNEVEYDLLSEKLNDVDKELASVYAVMRVTKKEMRYRVRRMFPKPMGITPKRCLQLPKSDTISSERYLVW